MLKAVILDLDGTMADTETMYSDAFADLLRNYHAEPKPYKHGLVHMVGKNTESILALLIKQYHIEGDIKTMVLQLRKKYFDLIKNGNVKPMKGLKKLLLLLKTNHIKMAVASGSSSQNIHTILDKLRIENFFDVVVGADEVSHGKPDPEIYENTVKKLGNKKNECIVIEDTEPGVTAAKKAGLKVIAVPNKFTSDHNFSKADTIVKSLNDVTFPLLNNL